MPLSRQQARDAFHHVMNNVLCCGDNSPLKIGLLEEGVEDIGDLCTYNLNDLATLTYHKPDDDQEYPVGRHEKNRVAVFRDFIMHRASAGNPINDNWLSITCEQYDEFRIDSTYIARLSLTP